jgi:hypothetical protein
MAIVTSKTQIQLYAVNLIKKLMNEFPKREFKLKTLTEMGTHPEIFIITGKIPKNIFRKKLIEGISSNNNSIIFTWEKDEEIKKFIASIINELNEHSAIKFKIKYK